MWRGRLGVALVAAAVFFAGTTSKSAASPIRVGDPYGGGLLVFHEAPAVALVPTTKVYYVRDRDCDLYRYGRYWYHVENGIWFRSRSWQGPFYHLNSSSVPRAVRTVPLNYRRHWQGPPPRAVAQGYDRKR